MLWCKMGLHEVTRTTNCHTILCVWHTRPNSVSDKTDRTRLWHQVQRHTHNEPQQGIRRLLGPTTQPLLPTSNNRELGTTPATTTSTDTRGRDSNDCPNHADTSRTTTSPWRKQRLLELQQWRIPGEVPQEQKEGTIRSWQQLSSISWKIEQLSKDNCQTAKWAQWGFRGTVQRLG